VHLLNYTCANVYKLLIKIPIFGEILRIANSYTYDGDLAADEKLAPISLWVKKHVSCILITVLLTLLSTPYIWLNCDWLQYFPQSLTYSNELEPGSLIISIFPNMLGFGIGVYALIFGLSSLLVKRVQENLTKKENDQVKNPGSVLLLNADMAYPLLAMMGALTVGIFQQAYPDSKMLEIIAWAVLWYSMLMILEILTALFALGETELLGKLNNKD